MSNITEYEKYKVDRSNNFRNEPHYVLIVDSSHSQSSGTWGDVNPEPEQYYEVEDMILYTIPRDRQDVLKGAISHLKIEKKTFTILDVNGLVKFQDDVKLMMRE